MRHAALLTNWCVTWRPTVPGLRSWKKIGSCLRLFLCKKLLSLLFQTRLLHALHSRKTALKHREGLAMYSCCLTRGKIWQRLTASSSTGMLCAQLSLDSQGLGMFELWLATCWVTACNVALTLKQRHGGSTLCNQFGAMENCRPMLLWTWLSSSI